MSNPTHLEHIGLMIQQARKTRGMSQEQLAEAASLRRETIVQIERGQSNFEINTLVRIASALKFYLKINISPAD